jgi:hypothetical protein
MWPQYASVVYNKERHNKLEQRVNVPLGKIMVHMFTEYEIYLIDSVELNIINIYLSLRTSIQ